MKIHQSLNAVIIDYGMGNLQSVKNALEKLGNCKITISSKAKNIKKSDLLIVPGVGAFEDAMNELNKRNLSKTIIQETKFKKKPLLGICLGMQLLFDYSEENGLHKGLGLIKGSVKKFNINKKYRIPHVGWNNIFFNKNSKFFQNINFDKNFYFVHSYHVITNKKYVITESNFGKNFVAAVAKKIIVVVQFHTEISQANVLIFIKNYFKILLKNKKTL